MSFDRFDRKWERMIRDMGLRVELYMRYVDDGMKFLHPVKKGWRLVENTLTYSRVWEMEDDERTPLERTLSIIKESLNKGEDYLEFTVETGDEYDGWFPTLDTNVRVNEKNIIEYKYFEKPATTNTTIRLASAMSENSKMQSLSNNLVRRLLNTKEDLPFSYKEDVIDHYGHYSMG